MLLWFCVVVLYYATAAASMLATAAGAYVYSSNMTSGLMSSSVSLAAAVLVMPAYTPTQTIPPQATVIKTRSAVDSSRC